MKNNQSIVIVVLIMQRIKPKNTFKQNLFGYILQAISTPIKQLNRSEYKTLILQKLINLALNYKYAVKYYGLN